LIVNAFSRVTKQYMPVLQLFVEARCCGGLQLDLLRSKFTPVLILRIRVSHSHRFNDMNRLLSVNKIHPKVDRVFSFEETKEAFEYLESQKHVGKVVIKVSND
jgi:NADPH:quinone reductase-like Zn-dependent oxidoreductase